jgi:hypothetical protein
LLGVITPSNTKKSGAQTSRGGGVTTLNQFSDIVSKTHQYEVNQSRSGIAKLMSAASDARKSAGSTMEFDTTMNRLKEQYNDVREAEVLRQREALETKVEYNN